MNLALLALVALLAFSAGWLAGWISASEYHWRHDRTGWPPVRGRRDEWGS